MQRQKHRPEVLAFLQKHFPGSHWDLSLPKGSGGETYFAHGDQTACFVKLGATTANYQVLSSIGLTPRVLAADRLNDGTSILVQAAIMGRTPSRKDFHLHLERIAAIIDTTHHSAELIRILPPIPSDLYRQIGLEALARLQQRWQGCKALVPAAAEFVNQSLAELNQQVQSFSGAGSAACHNDICNANWLLAADGQIYLIDLESMALEDPALDIGALLWWYYPPELRPRFLEIVGYAHDLAFQNRMRVRMAMHCLSILLPREHSFDRFDPEAFSRSHVDFKAVLAGQENPQAYE